VEVADSGGCNTANSYGMEMPSFHRFSDRAQPGTAVALRLRCRWLHLHALVQTSALF